MLGVVAVASRYYSVQYSSECEEGAKCEEMRTRTPERGKKEKYGKRLGKS